MAEGSFELGSEKDLGHRDKKKGEAQKREEHGCVQQEAGNSWFA